MWQRWLFLFSLVVFSGGAWADNSCEVTPTNDFTVTTSITDYQSNNQYDLRAKKGSTDVLIWSNHDPEAKILSTDLVDGESYDFRFVFIMENTSGDDVNGTLVYYRRISGNEVWSEVGRTEVTLHTDANTDVTIIGSDSITCNAEAEDTPSEIPDICSIVPGVLQTNNYNNGKPYAGILTVSTDNKVYLPYDETVMSFSNTDSDDCYYPSNIDGPGADCKIDPDKSIEGYPYELGDNPATEDLTIKAGETVTLDEGVYWYNNITFGGDEARLSVSGKVIIHYNTISFPTGELYDGEDNHQHVHGTVHINDDGDSTNLLFIGHGSNAQVTTVHESIPIHANAHFYINSGQQAGLSLAGSDSIFNGGVTANSVSLSGYNNVFDGRGSCEPEPEPEFDTCSYFPGAIQGNKYDVNGKFDSNPLVIARGNGQLGNRLYLDTLDSLPFSTSDTENNTSSNTSGCVYRAEDGSFTNAATGAGACDVAPSDIFAGNPPPADDFTISGDTITIADGSSQDVQPGYYTALNFGNNGSTAILQAGEYWIGDVNLTNNDAQIQTNGQVILHYKKFNISQSRHYINADPSRDSKSNMTPDQLTNIKDPSNLVLIGHGVNSQFLVDGSTQTTYVNALVYISPEAASPGFKVDGSQRFQFIGSISAPGVSLDNGTDYTYIYSKEMESCDSPTPDETDTIEVTPDDGYALTCNTPNITFTVKDEEGNIATDYSGNINATFPNGLVPDNDNIIQGKVIDADNNIYQPVDGQVIVPVTASEYKQFTVDGELADDTTQTDSGSIEFVPFKFGIDDQHIIANKPQTVTVQALACDSQDTGKEVAVNYSGKPDVTSNLTEPEQGVGDLTFAPEFTDTDEGEVSSDLTFTDSGKLTVTLEDKNFDCTGLDGCPIGDDGKNDGVLKGSFTVYSRPWTFAICDADGSDMDGNITDAASQGFKAAGEEFSLNIKPLRWVEGDSDPVTGSPDIDVTELCDKPITQNFTASDSPKATIQLDYQLAEPSTEAGGHEGALSGTQSLSNTDNAGSGESAYYDFSGLSWSEVGVITMQVSIDEAYYNMSINQGYRNIGRFYPHHLALIDSDNVWSYPTGQVDFAYMNQPTHMEYTVEAQNASDGATENYGYFADELLAKMRVVAVDTTQNNAEISTDRYTEDTAQAWNEADYQYSTDEFVFYKSVADDSPYTSQADGPFNGDNSVWGVLVTDETVDKVNFEFDEQSDDGFQIDNTGDRALSFAQKPTFRYGRMTLDNVSGPIGGPVSVPMRVEYWDSESKSFVVNKDDSGSDFISSVYCAIDDDSGASTDNAVLTDSDDDKATHTVDEGKSGILLAQQNSAQKQTARIFLRQGSDDEDYYFNNPIPADTNCTWNNDDQSVEQPWLQYNWRTGKGDEDPSTLVTFGAYRGNDRIIYRGEPELTEN